MTRTMIKILDISQSIWGWVLICLSFLVSYFGEAGATLAGVTAVVVIDGVFGVILSIKRGDFIMSYLGRETISKLLIYLLLIIVVYIAEDTAPDWGVIATPLIAALICAVEIWSILGHISILKPDLPLVCLLRKALKGEIARKLSITTEEVDDLLKKTPDNDA